jgi:transcriptional regulator with XRE-family HTH domain
MLNEALRLVRVFHDLTKSEAAERVGMSKSYVTELEHGSKNVTLEVLKRYRIGLAFPPVGKHPSTVSSFVSIPATSREQQRRSRKKWNTAWARTDG